jgi:hypothetical protein
MKVHITRLLCSCACPPLFCSGSASVACLTCTDTGRLKTCETPSHAPMLFTDLGASDAVVVALQPGSCLTFTRLVLVNAQPLDDGVRDSKTSRTTRPAVEALAPFGFSLWSYNALVSLVTKYHVCHVRT